MFSKTLRTFIKELGKLHEQHTRVYKQPKKFRHITSNTYTEFCYKTKVQILEKNPEWFDMLCTELKFPIHCNDDILQPSHDTIWNHIYTLYISAVKEECPEIVSYLQNTGDIEIDIKVNQ